MLAALVALLTQILHTILVLLAAPLLAGLSASLDARLAGRAGPPLLDPLHDLVRLARKTPAVPEHASPLLSWSASVQLGAMLAAAALVPSFSLGMALSPLADGLVVAGLLSIGRVAACLGALDTGAAGPGHATELGSTAAVLAEAGLLLLLFGLATMGGGFNLNQISAQQHEFLLQPPTAAAMALACLLVLAFADLAAPAPDLAADLSGIDLAMTRAAVWLRRIVWFNLIGAVFLPVFMAGAGAGPAEWATGILAWAVRLVAAAACFAAAQALLGRPDRNRQAGLLWLGGLLALLATLAALSGSGVV